MQNRKLAVALGLLGATILTAPAGAQTTAGSTTPVSAASAPDQTAQTVTIETVIVTARRRAEDLEKVPLAVTAISPETLRENTIRSALSLQDLSPSLTVAANLGSRDDNVFTIRGQSQPFGGADPGVQTYFNEVPFGGSGPANYYDMDNIQILRGPQGTLFGRNTTGGAVLFQPKKPSDQFGGYLDASGGDYAMGELQGAINLPIAGDALAIRVAGDVASRKGYTQDVTTNSDLDNLHYDAFRVGIIMRPFAGFENYTAFNYINDHNNGTGSELTSLATEPQLENLFDPQVIPLIIQELEGMGYTPTQAAAAAPTQASALIQGFYNGYLAPALANQQALGTRKTTSSIPLFYKRNSWSITDTAQYDIAEHLRLRNIFGYLSDKEQSAFDYDGSYLPILDIPNPRTWEQNSRQITEEIQLQGETDDWTWILGAYYEHDYKGGYAEVERDLLGGLSGPFPGLGSTEVDALGNGGVSQALYGSVGYDASDWVKGLSFNAGGRFTWDHKISDSTVCVQSMAQPSPCPYPLVSTPLNFEHDSASFHAPSWTLATNYQINDDTLLYGTYRRGYKSGGFNGGAAGTGLQEFRPEFLTDVELGTKNNWTILDVPGRTNFDLYYGWYQDIQKNDEVAIETPSSERVVALTANAAKAEIKGLEFESTFIPDDNFQVTAFYSYADASYSKFELPQAIFIDPLGNVTLINPLDHKGDPFAFTPKHKLGFTGRYHLPVDSALGTPYLTATWYWQSKVWFTDLADLEPQAFQADYGLVNLRLDWNSFLGSSFDASVFVNNLTDRTYKVGANAMEHLTGTTSSIYAAPRMFGVELRYRFGAEGAQ
jgi:iron complex outermembrane receptor protein